ncbi:MAG: isoprenylcysteine carboxylmethyltransferase family protein [Proteobacteria bacterium]|nr:isoprenylcysteine carboxylmethyltransferase family protein [Pseudomonadota bacterium]
MSTATAPKLLKARQRHTRWFAALLVLAILFSRGMMPPDGFWVELLQWVGYALVIACVLGRSYCSAFIGGIKNEGVMRMGPYGVVRNPLYVFSFLGVVGIGLQSGSILVAALLVATFMAYYTAVVAKEEAFLENKFGDEYRQYKAEVPRWLPALSKWREPEEMLTRPRFIRQTMMDAAVFFVALPAFETLEVLHAHGIIPTLLTLP